MGERYTIINEEKAPYFRCPFPLTDTDDGGVCSCAAGNCMAWIEELDDKGRATGRGRCGMVPARIERAPA